MASINASASTGMFDMSSASLITPPPSRPPSPTRAHEKLALPLSLISSPPYTPKPDFQVSSVSWACDLEKGPTEHSPRVQDPSATASTKKQSQSKVSSSPPARLLLLAKIIIPLTALNTALSFPFGASSALLGTHILSWQWPAYVDILSWRFMFLAVLCGCTLVGCFFAVVLGFLPDREPAEPSSRLSDAEWFATLVGFGLFMSVFAFALGALALHNAPLEIPSSLTPARALAANATGLVVMGCVGVAYMSLCSFLARRPSTNN
ncbi:hypothetical protein L226DRAFT_534944 [Lentinus tigrinus ALCF2SS1-7]|uniref:Uncharacterized protein n=1 Tax=Lentinus tigrinus ALCF2SS1-6 TaxID=1328759 RepID=A0A5C2S800_9APHY|nr:hypothetical protein L227DRAFT_104123 [Lentinus tigrinus ALCF2SS1-6]RPD74728.1 hypothetical protein L226DRAFT_534944 [Lentinus tigrinus ALCF2SS1-7]